MLNNFSQLEFDFGSLETFKIETRAPKNLTDMVVKSSSDECNAAITQVYIDSERVEDTKEESLQEEYTPEQIFQRRQELLQHRKRFVQTVLDAVYLQYKIEIDELLALEPKWQTLAKTNFDRVKRWGVARLIKQIVVDDEKLKELLKIKVDIDGSKKAIKNLPYIKSFLARCRVGEDRLIGVQSLKGDEKCEIAAQHFQNIKEALEDYRVEVLKEFKIVDGKKITYKKRVKRKNISLKNTLKNSNLRNEIVKASHSITDLESFRGWLRTNLSFEQVSIENSDENILFCVFVLSLRKIVGEKILAKKIDTIELYKSLFNGRFISKTLYNSPFKIKALDTTFIEYRDSLWESYLNTPDFFTKYPSYYFWLKDAPEAQGLKKKHLVQVWGMIPYDFRDKWSKINLPFEDADNLYKAFEEIQNNWKGNTVAQAQFFAQYPSYYFWLKDVAEEKGLKTSNLGQVWSMIPDEFRSDGRNDDKWSNISLPFEDADKLHKAFKKVQEKWNGDAEAKAQFFAQYPSYYFWLTSAPEARDLKNINLGQVWGMIPDEFREQWSVINLPFEDADKLHNAFEKVQNSWGGNEDAKEQFFRDYPSYYFWLKNAREAKGLKKSHLGHVWGMIPDEFREHWSIICLSFEDADKLHKAFEEVQEKWNGNAEAKAQFFKDYPSYYFWLKDVAEAQGLKTSNLGQVWSMIPDEFRSDGRNDDKWSNISLPFEDADKLCTAFYEVQNSWNGNDEEKDEFFTKYPSYYFWLKDVAEKQGLNKSHLGSVWGMIPDEFREQWSKINLPFEDADKLHVEILDDSKTWCANDSRAYMQHFSQTNLYFAFYWGLIPISLRQKFNLEYYYPGKIDYNGIKVDSKQEFAVLRVFEEVLGYEPEVGVNFQVKVDSKMRHTFDFKIEYQEKDAYVTHFFEWHPVVVSMNGGRNDAFVLDEYQDIVDLIDDDYLTDSELITYAQEQVEKQYYNKRFELLTNNTSNTFRGDVRLTCATAGTKTGGLNKNLATLHGFLQHAKPDFELTLAQLTTMFKGYLGDVLKYEVELVEGA